MRPLPWILGLFLAVPLVGCTSSGSDGTGDDEGVDTDTDTTSDVTGCGEKYAGSCSLCKVCAVQTVCTAEREACSAEAECGSFSICVQGSTDPGVIASCGKEFPDGVEPFCAQERCAIADCTEDCGASPVCP